MTEPVNMKKFGGLSYNANLVSSTKKLKNGNYEMIFKSGEKITYPYQKDFVPDKGYTDTAVTGENMGTYVDADFNPNERVPRNARIDQSINENLVYDDTYFDITNVMGATFTSSKDTVSHVRLNNSSNTTINLAANDSKWYSDTANIDNGANNKVILDKEDTAIINGNSVKGQGTAAQKDYQKY